MTEQEKANSREEGFLAPAKRPGRKTRASQTSLGMAIIFCDGLFGMMGLGERLGFATIPPLRGGKKRRLSGRDDKSREGKPKTHTQNRRVGHPAEEKRFRGIVALDRKNPPFAKGAKDGAPSRIFGVGVFMVRPV
jgi:hypothetical protein